MDTIPYFAYKLTDLFHSIEYSFLAIAKLFCLFNQTRREELVETPLFLPFFTMKLNSFEIWFMYIDQRFSFQNSRLSTFDLLCIVCVPKIDKNINRISPKTIVKESALSNQIVPCRNIYGDRVFAVSTIEKNRLLQTLFIGIFHFQQHLEKLLVATF